MSHPTGMSVEMREMVSQTLRDVVARELPDETLLDLDAQDLVPLDLIRRMLSPELGLHLIFLPEEVGGLGGGARDICAISEQMAAVDLGLATAFMGICLGTDPILVGATEEQRLHWLGKVAEGLIVAYAVTEPEAGSNLAALHTTAKPRLDAAGTTVAYRLNGTKQFITNGGVADLYTVLAKTPGGPSFFVVEKGTPGLLVGRKEKKHGIRLSNTTSVLLEEAEVPAENLIGGIEGEGLKQANLVFGYTRLMVGAMGLGGGQNALERALAYAKMREQFGGPLVEKQGYMFKLILPSWIDLAAGRAYVSELADTLDTGVGGMQVEGSIAKLWATEAANRAADAAVQALGGYGYMHEYMVEKLRRDVRILTIYEGTSEIQQQIISMFRWKETVRSKGSYYEDAAAALESLGEAKVGATLVAAALRALNRIIGHCHKTKLTRHQAVMFALAELITRTEVAAAFCRHAAQEQTSAAMCRIFARDTLTEIRRRGAALACECVEPDDEAGLSAAQALAQALEAGPGAREFAGALGDRSAVADHLRSLG